jgi:hypothetical protein
VGVHWGGGVQVDVVAVGWREQAILLGECKWGIEPVSRSVVRELIQKKRPRVLQRLPGDGLDWTIYYAFFSRAGFAEATQAQAEAHGALLVDLPGYVGLRLAGRSVMPWHTGFGRDMKGEMCSSALGRLEL